MNLQSMFETAIDALDPAPVVEILTFNERGPVLAVRPFVHA